MSESKTICPFCGRLPGEQHAEDCPRYGPNRSWSFFERITMPDKIRNADKIRLYNLVRFLCRL